MLKQSHYGLSVAFNDKDGVKIGDGLLTWQGHGGSHDDWFESNHASFEAGAKGKAK